MRFIKRKVFEVFFLSFQQTRPSALHREMFSIVTVPSLQRPVLDVSVGPSFLIMGRPSGD